MSDTDLTEPAPAQEAPGEFPYGSKPCPNCGRFYQLQAGTPCVFHQPYIPNHTEVEKSLLNELVRIRAELAELRAAQPSDEQIRTMANRALDALRACEQDSARLAEVQKLLDEHNENGGANPYFTLSAIRASIAAEQGAK